MVNGNVKLRVRVGAAEIDIESSTSDLQTVVDMVPEVIKKLQANLEPASATARIVKDEDKGAHELIPARPSSVNLPEISVEKEDSLTDVITKLFQDPWGRHPRKLAEVREALESYGLIYPKQSVAVALLRLAQSGKLRRFKGEEAEFVYTISKASSTTVGVHGRMETLQSVSQEVKAPV
jgi:hypothetical protein